MLCGIPPFYNDNLEKMYELIKFSDLRFPKRIKFSEEAQDILIKVIIYIVYQFSILISYYKKILRRG